MLFFQRCIHFHFPAVRPGTGKTPKLGGGNSNIFLFHTENWGRWTHFDDHIFQMVWFNQQRAKMIVWWVNRGWKNGRTCSFSFRWTKVVDGLVCADLALVSGSAVVNEPLGLLRTGCVSGCWEMLKKMVGMFYGWILVVWKHTRPETNSSRLDDFPSGKVVLRGYVSFRVIIFQKAWHFRNFEVVWKMINFTRKPDC